MLNDDIKQYDQEKYEWLKKYDIQTADDFKQFCIDLHEQDKRDLLLSIMKYRMNQCNEYLDFERLEKINRREFERSPALDQMMREWIDSLPKFDIFLLVMLADIYFSHKSFSSNNIFLIDHF